MVELDVRLIVGLLCFVISIVAGGVTATWLLLRAAQSPRNSTWRKVFGLYMGHDFTDADINHVAKVVNRAVREGKIEFAAPEHLPDEGAYMGDCACGCGRPVYWSGTGRKPKYVDDKHRIYFHRYKKSHPDPFN